MEPLPTADTWSPKYTFGPAPIKAQNDIYYQHLIQPLLMHRSDMPDVIFFNRWISESDSAINTLDHQL